jgi:hypothetical protein
MQQEVRNIQQMFEIIRMYTTVYTNNMVDTYTPNELSFSASIHVCASTLRNDDERKKRSAVTKTASLGSQLGHLAAQAGGLSCACNAQHSSCRAIYTQHISRASAKISAANGLARP